MMKRNHLLVRYVTIFAVSIILLNVTNVGNLIVSSIMRNNEKPEFPINEEAFCKPDEHVLLLVGVYSGTDQELERNFIREKWGAKARGNRKIRLLFFLGLPSREENMVNIRKESQTYHDIIQMNATDTYRNLTLKSFAFFRWSQTYCRGAKYLLKIDSDMHIDLISLVNALERSNVSDSYQCGTILYKQHPVRDMKHKWYVLLKTYAKMVFPPYCYGPAYFVSKRIASKIATVPIPKDPFPVDDVYMTGILREMLKEKVREGIITISASHYLKTHVTIRKGNTIIYIKPVGVKKKLSN